MENREGEETIPNDAILMLEVYTIKSISDLLEFASYFVFTCHYYYPLALHSTLNIINVVTKWIQNYFLDLLMVYFDPFYFI